MRVKKILCCIAALAQLALGAAFPGVSAEADTPLADLERFWQLAGKLERLGVLPQGLYSLPGDTVTRGQAAQLAALLRGVAGPELTGEGFYKDVAEGSRYYNGISAAFLLGIISPAPDGLFRPEDPVTYQELLKIFIESLGYGELARDKGGYPAGYLMAARELKLTAPVSGSFSEAVSAGGLLAVLNAAVQADIPTAVRYRDGVADYEILRGTTVLSQFHSIYSASGQVESVGSSGIAAAAAPRSVAVISGVSYRAQVEAAAEHLGATVKFYYRDADGERTLLYAEPAPGREILELDAREIEDFQDGVFYYRLGETGGVSRARTTDSPYVLYNGRLATSDIENLYTPRDGRVRLIDNQGSGRYDVVIVSAYENYVVEAVDTKNKVLYDKYDPAKRLEFSDEDIANDRKLLTQSGKEIFASTLGEWTVVSAIVSDDGSYVRGVVSNSKKAGVISSVERDGTDRGFLTLDTERLELADNLLDSADAVKLSPGQSVECYLDYRGRVAAVSFLENQSLVYGYILGASLGEGLAGGCRILLLGTDGEKASYTLSASALIDGERYKTPAGQLAAVERGIARTGVARYTPAEEKMITELDTTLVAPKENAAQTLREYLPKTLDQLYKNSGNVEDKFYVNTKTVIFAEYSAIREVQERFGVLDMSKLTNDKRYPVSAYAVGETLTPQVAIFEMESAAGTVTDITMHLVEKVAQGFSEDGDMYDILSLYNGAAHTRLYCPAGLAQAMGIKKGDIIRRDTKRGEYLLNDYIVKTYDYESGSLLEGYINPATQAVISTNAGYAARLGYVYERSGDHISIALANSAGGIDTSSLVVTTIPAARFKYSVGRDIRMEDATQNDLKPYTVFGDECAKILVRFRYRVPYQLMVIE